MAIQARKIREADLEKIRQWRMSPEVSAYMHSDRELTPEDQRRWFEHISTCPTVRYWMIVADGEDVGVLNLVGIDEVNKRCEWAYYLGSESARGKGIGKSMELSLFYFVFETLGLNKLCGEVLSSNQFVIDIHRKYGFEVEGNRRQHIFKNGCFHDVVEVGILREDWKANVKGKFEFQRIELEQ